jgi:hypothetical protein
VSGAWTVELDVREAWGNTAGVSNALHGGAVRRAGEGRRAVDAGVEERAQGTPLAIHPVVVPELLAAPSAFLHGSLHAAIANRFASPVGRVVGEARNLFAR